MPNDPHDAGDVMRSLDELVSVAERIALELKIGNGIAQFKVLAIALQHDPALKDEYYAVIAALNADMRRRT